MASEPSQTTSLQYQTWALKVSIHCQGCKAKIKKLLHSIEGVYTTSIDSQQQRVVVTCNVDPQTLIKKLAKNRKHAELWPENPSIQNQAGNNHKENSENSEDEEEKHNKNPLLENSHGNNLLQVQARSPRTNSMKIVRFAGVNNKLPENFAPVAEQKVVSGGKKKKKKKKKKSQNGNNNPGTGAPPSDSAPGGTGQAVDQNPTIQNVYDYPTLPNYVPQLAQQGYVVSYNASQPIMTGAPGYYVPSSPHVYSTHEESEDDQEESTALDSFEILSEENPNGCYVM